MLNVDVKSTVSVKIGAHTFEMTRAEAQNLLHQLQRELGQTNPYPLGNPFLTFGQPHTVINTPFQVGSPSYPIAPGTITC